MLEGVETYGGRVGGVRERWRSVVGGVGVSVSVSVREVEVCEKGGGVWEGWRCVGEVEVCERGGEVRW